MLMLVNVLLMHVEVLSFAIKQYKWNSYYFITVIIITLSYNYRNYY